MTWVRLCISLVFLGLTAVVPASAQQLSAPVCESLDPHPVRAALQTDDDFADLEPLAAAIGDSRIVVLGEATHSDGAVSAAKARVVRFLHQRMGFDVLAWESGVVQTLGMDAALRDPATDLLAASGLLMSGGWAREADIRPVFEYARGSWLGDRPLHMAGVDSGRPPAASHLEARLRELWTRVPRLEPDSADAERIAALTARALGFRGPSAEVDAEDRARERAAVERLGAAVAAERTRPTSRLGSREIALWDRVVGHLLESDELKARRGRARNVMRDRVMAENLRWLADVYYPDRKLIVWAATAHFIRNSSEIARADGTDPYVTAWEAGNYVWDWFGDAMYTLGFTTWGGEQGHLWPAGSTRESVEVTVDPAPPGTLEHWLHARGLTAAFVDLEGVGSCSFEAMALGRFHTVAPWGRVLDGFYFVDRSRPVRYLR